MSPASASSRGILEFRNVSAETCSVEGHPVVHFSDPESAAAWGPAASMGTVWSAVPFDLAPDAIATAGLAIRRASEMCAAPVPTDGLVVGPPSEPFDPAADGRHLLVSGLEFCPDGAVQLLTVEGFAR